MSLKQEDAEAAVGLYWLAIEARTHGKCFFKYRNPLISHFPCPSLIILMFSDHITNDLRVKYEDVLDLNKRVTNKNKEERNRARCKHDESSVPGTADEAEN